jgi:hypothetical protein
MKSTLTFIAAVLFAATSATAGPSGNGLSTSAGTFAGLSVSVQSNGVSRTSSGRNNGNQGIMNESTAGQMAVVSTGVTFDQSRSVINEHGRTGSRNSNGIHTHTNNTDRTNGVSTVVSVEAFTDGFDRSRTLTWGNGGGDRSGSGYAVRSARAGGLGSTTTAGRVSVFGSASR